MSANLFRQDSATTGQLGLPVFDAFPYLLVRISPAFYQILLLPTELPQPRLIAAARKQVLANRLEACLALGRDRAIYFNRAGEGSRSEVLPAGGNIVAEKGLLPGWELPESEENRRRTEKLLAYEQARNAGARYLLGDLTKGGRPARLDEARALRGRNAAGVPNGLEPCAACGYWSGNCLDPAPQFRDAIVTVHCLCANDNRCARCGERLAQYRLNANFYDANQDTIFHVPGFSGFRHQCAANQIAESSATQSATQAECQAAPGSEAAAAFPSDLKSALTQVLETIAAEGKAKQTQTMALIASSPRLRAFLELLADATGEEALRPRNIEALPGYQEFLRHGLKELTPEELDLESQIVQFLETLLEQLPPRSATTREPC